MENTRPEEKCEVISTAENKKHEDRFQIQSEPPKDGGWRWVVCLGALTVNFLTVGQQNSAGVLYSAVLNEYSTQRGETGEKREYCFKETLVHSVTLIHVYNIPTMIKGYIEDGITELK